MINAALGKQLMITVQNKIGALAEISALLAKNGINIIAVCAHAVDNTGTIMFVTEDNEHAKRLLKEKKYATRDEEVILIALDNKAGSLEKIAEKISNSNIDITLVYATVDKKGKSSTAVIVTENNALALAAIKS